MPHAREVDARGRRLLIGILRARAHTHGTASVVICVNLSWLHRGSRMNRTFKRGILILAGVASLVFLVWAYGNAIELRGWRHRYVRAERQRLRLPGAIDQVIAMMRSDRL